MGQVRAWGPGDVAALADGPLGAYVHIPFCRRICPFCPYNKVVPAGDEPQRYFAALQREIACHRSSGIAGDRGFTSLYIGGGTPTLYPEHLAEVIAAVPVSGERAVEVLPTHANPAGLAQLRSIGVTAVSIGAQSFSDPVLRQLRRPHDAAQAHAAVAAAVGRFDLVDVDLIVDVELDDRLAGTFLRDFAECLRLGADQVSTYPLMRFGYTPFGRGRHDRRREHAVLAAATRIAHCHGYERRSVWTFNRREAGTYTSITRRRFLGMGAGASSFLGRDFLVNHFGVRTYIAAVSDGRLPIARQLHLGPVGGAAYDAFWQAYAGHVDLPGLVAAYGPGAAALWAVLAPARAAGLLRAGEHGDVVLTDHGFDTYHDLERWVTYTMIEPLWGQMLREHADEGRHATWASPRAARTPLLWRAVDRVLTRSAA